MSTPQSLVGRVWHGDTVVGSWIGNPEESGLVKGIYEPQESEALGEMYKGESVREISVTSNPPSSRDTRELEETREKFL